MPGGTARATVETVRALGRHEDVDVVPLAAWHRSASRDRADELGDGVGPVNHVPLPRPVLYESWLRFRRPVVESLVGPVDVVWASSMIMVPSRSAPVVATVHDLGFLDRPEQSSRRGRDFFPRAWEAVRRHADRVVCPSRVVADECAGRGIAPERLSVVPWGVEPPQSTEADATAVRARFGLPDRFVLWVGTVEPRKNLPRLVEAMAALPEEHLAVVGPDGWNVDGTDLLAPLGDRVHRLGRVSEHELSALYRAATVFVLPSVLEGFGLPVAEAMAHGTPVVTSAGTATEEVAGGAARLVDPADADALAAAIDAVTAEPDVTDRLVARGRERAAELTWAATAEGYRKVFAASAADAPVGRR
ncbi:MAG: glycosyltransferase family 1 protein [Actinomycetota bacterium]